MSDYKTPHVHTALAKILEAMSVEKNGTLPSNMSGKPYITATDLNAEAKRQFVSNDLFMLPSEKIVKHETVLNKDRLSVLIAVEGTYTLISTVDGSSVEFSGAGDGLAQGSAVASNIASTNALKNALLRTFLVTEQSVEDAGKNGVPDSAAAPDRQTPAQQKIARAATPATSEADKIKDVIQAEFIATKLVEPIVVKTLSEKVAAELNTDNKSLEVRTEVLKRLRAGEVA